jgi:hypothetical protein
VWSASVGVSGVAAHTLCKWRVLESAVVNHPILLLAEYQFSKKKATPWASCPFLVGWAVTFPPWSEVRLSPLGMSATFWPFVPATDDR